MKIETYQCDMCGRKKGESNHWLKVYQALRTGDESFTLTKHSTPMPSGLLEPSTLSAAWSNTVNKTFDLCSAECATKCLSEFLAKGRA